MPQDNFSPEANKKIPGTRTCQKCRRSLTKEFFPSTSSPFFPAGHSIICIDCLEKMTNPDDLNSVDRTLRYLDLPFNPDLWISIYSKNPQFPFSSYINVIEHDKQYSSSSWSEENVQWKIANETKKKLRVVEEAELLNLRRVWGETYTPEELSFLNEFYDKVVSTQNVSTPILQEYARDLCEIEQRIKKGQREGIDIKKDMDARDNIIKMAKFDASNSKNTADFDTVGELMVYFEKEGWHPKYHEEPKDSIDFLQNNIQQYLQRLYNGEGTIADQVDDARDRFNTSKRLEELGAGDVRVRVEMPDSFEGEEELAGEISDWNS